MREILFRGKRIDNGEWAEGYFVETEYKEYHAFIIVSADWEVSDECAEFLATEIYEVIPETVGQYTGLADKNGKKIFEGDIMEYTFGGRTNIDVIEYSCTSFSPSNVMRWSLHKDKIIGNIHDNPELLNGTND